MKSMILSSLDYKLVLDRLNGRTYGQLAIKYGFAGATQARCQYLRNILAIVEEHAPTNRKIQRLCVEDLRKLGL